MAGTAPEDYRKPDQFFAPTCPGVSEMRTMSGAGLQSNEDGYVGSLYIVVAFASPLSSAG